MNRVKQAQELGKMLRKLMKDRGWTARELSRQSGIPSSSMNNYVAGMVFPEKNKEAREKLAGLFKIDVVEFDAKFGIATPTPSAVDAICRDIRLLSREEFKLVAEVVFNRALRELQDSEPIED